MGFGRIFSVFFKYVALALMLLGVHKGHAGFPPPVVIEPPNPQAGEMVRVGIFVEYYPPCLILPRENSLGETNLLTIDGNDIQIEVLADSFPLCNPIPFDPAPREYYDLGVFQEGEYTVDVNYIAVGDLPPQDIPPFPLPDFFVSDDFGSPVTFTVRGAPQAVDAMSLPSIFILALLFLCLIYFRS